MTAILFAFLLLIMVLVIFYLLFTKTHSLRLLTLSYFSNLLIGFICLYGVVSRNTSYIDLALIYALISPAATIIITRFLKGEK